MTSGASGVCVADPAGLCISAQGSLDAQAAVVGAQLLSLASAIDSRQSPVVVLQSEHDEIVYSRAGDVTVGVHTKELSMSTSLTLEFSGGSEFLVGDQKIHQAQIEGQGIRVSDVFVWLRRHLLKDCDRTELLLQGETVRPGVLILINDTDWELFELENTELKSGDKVTFISTLHGG